MQTENTFVDEVYGKLDYNNGGLFDLAQSLGNIDDDSWLNKGEWLLAAKKAGAEKIFFVGNNPIIVFAKCNNKQNDKIQSFNKLWSLARPRILFLECEGELSVIDLAQRPISPTDQNRKITSLETIIKIKEVAEKLQAFHRDNIESGKVFGDKRFGDLKHRADQSLISNLKIVRKELIDAGLCDDKLKYAHALIGRSIFIRYLEDREILTEDYFRNIAKKNPKWLTLISNSTAQDKFDFSGVTALYPKVLQSKDFTYALFRSLSKDFNGDMFPDVEKEEQYVKLDHLKIIQDLLYGNVGIQKKLFFYSYKFDIIPLDLISAIYEEFYHSTPNEQDEKSKARQDGAFYTPSVLAEFVLSRVLTAKELKTNPKVLDPACGSGIFLVEAFRRMVRFSWKNKGKSLNFNEVKEILGNQILGIEANKEAARITAFSLYLAMLHYLDPPSILDQIKKGNKLPNLLLSDKKGSNYYNTIRVENTFDTCNNDLNDIDIIVGNPPWGAPGKNADIITKERQEVMIKWCQDNACPIGDKEPSQAFLWRSLDFLKNGGHCALLTSAGVLFKHSSTTQTFRTEWMNKVCLEEVFNFTHVRKFFFKGAVSPFVMIHFTKGKQKNKPVEYWSPKQVISLKETQSILCSQYDRNYLVEQDLTDNKTWKINWFGCQTDRNFFKQLQYLKKISEYVDLKISGRGFQKGNQKLDSKWLLCFKEMPSKQINRYNHLLEFCDPPGKVEARGKNKKIYTGRRIIVKRGISQKNNLINQIVSKFVDDDFCFRNSIHCIKLKKDEVNQYLLFQGILWSSFSRYYLFFTSANWGLWHDEIHLEELFQLPIPRVLNNAESDKVTKIVKKLRDYHPEGKDIFHQNEVSKKEIESQRHEWELELDEAVFDLYEFSEEQRDLIRDCCEVTLPFFYQPFNSVGVMPAIKLNDITWIQKYAKIFADLWQPYLNDDEVMRADIHLGASGNMLAFEFYPADIGDEWNLKPKKNSWEHILEEIGKALPKPMGTSQIVLDGIVHAISDDAIIIIKRNEKRFWTRSLAREDANSTLCKRMHETMPQNRGVDNG
jgi:type I restriction-modification system DNA methylase subunit